MSPPGLVDLTAWLLRTRVLCTAVHGCVLLPYTLSATRSLTHKSRLRVACVWSPPPASGTGYSSSAILYTNVRFGLYKTR